MAARKVVVRVKDEMAGEFGPLASFRTIGEAERWFKHLLDSPESGMIHQYPEDHDLYAVGEEDSATGEVEKMAVTKIGNGALLSKSDPSRVSEHDLPTDVMEEDPAKVRELITESMKG